MLAVRQECVNYWPPMYVLAGGRTASIIRALVPLPARLRASNASERPQTVLTGFLREMPFIH